MIDAVGAVGRSLWDIYKTNVEKNQNQMKLDEQERSNKAQETHNANVLNATEAWRKTQQENSEREFKFKQEADARDYALKQQQLNAQIQAQNENRAFNQWYKNQILQSQQNENLRRQQEVQAKAAQEALNRTMLFNQMGGVLPKELENASPQVISAYQEAFLNPNAVKMREAEAKAAQELQANPLKNLPVGTQNRLNNAKTLLDRYVPYANDLVANESQISGGIDNLTAPLGKALGLNSDAIAGLYADAEAIADMERAYTKGGGNQAKISALKQITPVNTLFSTTLSGVASRIDNQLSAYNEVIKMLEAQGNYSGVKLLEEQKNELIERLPKEITPFLQKRADTGQKTSSVEEQFKKRAQQQTQTQSFHDQMDENGGYYSGGINPLDEDW